MEKVNNVSKLMESKRYGNRTINNCRHSVAKLFKDKVWSIEGKWIEKKKDKSVRAICVGEKPTILFIMNG